jgi:hypothetical protein
LTARVRLQGLGGLECRLLEPTGVVERAPPSSATDSARPGTNLAGAIALRDLLVRGQLRVDFRPFDGAPTVGLDATEALEQLTQEVASSSDSQGEHA